MALDLPIYYTCILKYRFWTLYERCIIAPMAGRVRFMQSATRSNIYTACTCLRCVSMYSLLQSNASQSKTIQVKVGLRCRVNTAKSFRIMAVDNAKLCFICNRIHLSGKTSSKYIIFNNYVQSNCYPPAADIIVKCTVLWVSRRFKTVRH